MEKSDILTYLSRNDKWSLGGGKALLWAPTHPQWLEHPGFWDGAHYFSCEFGPVFTITLLDGRGKVIVPKFRRREWNPAFLTQEYEASGKIAITEKKALLPNDTLVCELTLKNNGTVPQTLHCILWTAQRTFADPDGGSLSHVACDGKTIQFRRGLKGGEGGLYELACSLGVNRSVTSYSINASQAVPNFPQWEYSPFCDMFDGRKLSDEIETGGLKEDGLVYMALHVSLKLNPHARKTICGAASISGDLPSAQTHLAESLRARNPIRLSMDNWRSFFQNVPHFECSDPYLEKYYWYRWYGQKLLSVEGREKPFTSPAIGEGPAVSHLPASCSAQAHMRETRWMRTADVAQGRFLNLLEHHRANGAHPGRLAPGQVPGDELSLADWGQSVLDLCAVHPDEVFLERAYRSLVVHARHCDRERDCEGSGLYDIVNPRETCPEWSCRYPVGDEEAGTREKGHRLRLKGVDATTWVYRLKEALRLMAERLGKDEEAASWAEEAERIRLAMLKMMWDDTEEMFFDVDPRTMRRTGVKAAACFYPYMTAIVDERHVAGLKRHLLNPEEFWTPFPVASLSRDDARFNPAGQREGVRRHRPGNGRVWPMINSLLVEALANVARNWDPALRQVVVELLNSSVRMMFRKGDVRYPSSHEHYHPLTGQPCLHLGMDDHQVSGITDLIITYVAGICPSPDGNVVVDPFPFDISRIHVDRIPCQGHLLGVDMDEQSIILFLDGKRFASGKRGERLDVQICPGEK